MDSKLSITDHEFLLFKDLIYNICGINLTPNKKHLLISRLEKRIKTLNLPSFRSYREYLLSGKDKKEFVEMLNAISTNKTEFFRENDHFEFLKKNVYTNLLKNRSVRIWSAGCSSGEEPYTIAITLFEMLDRLTFHDIKILATDLCTDVLNKGKQGIYGKTKTTCIPPVLLKKYFLKGANHHEGKYMIKDSVKEIIRFRRLNLMEKFPFSGMFDIIFCRNVMIYFDKKTQTNLIRKFESKLKVGGYLIIGHSENLSGVQGRLTYIQPTIYCKN